MHYGKFTAKVVKDRNDPWTGVTTPLQIRQSITSELAASKKDSAPRIVEMTDPYTVRIMGKSDGDRCYRDPASERVIATVILIYED